MKVYVVMYQKGFKIGCSSMAFTNKADAIEYAEELTNTCDKVWAKKLEVIYDYDDIC